MLRLQKIILTMLLSTLSSYAQAEGEKANEKNKPSYIDYKKLDHELVVIELRAGNHDSKGVNNYYFLTTLYAVKKDLDEKKLGFEKRASLKKEYDKFGEIEIAALTTWAGEPKLEMKLNGDDMRVLTTEAMHEWKLPEEKVALLVDVAMYEKAKRFWFFGEDKLIGRMRYSIIPETTPHTPPRQNRDLVLEDRWGTHLKLSIKYAPEEDAKTAAATPK